VVDEFSYLPVFALVDWDPSGFEILCTYTFGSASQAALSRYLAVPSIFWLGLFPDDIADTIVAGCSIPFGKRDIGTLEKRLNENIYSSSRHQAWKEQLVRMQKGAFKLELEAFESVVS
jgi:meiotic recombination protein SPO11